MSDILLIEDDEAIRELVKVYLHNAGHTVREAENGHAGVELVRAQRPDIIILDLNMPVMDGTKVMKALKTDNDLKTIPVIAISAVAAPEMRDDMHALGCDVYITKPVNFGALLEKISRLTKA